MTEKDRSSSPALTGAALTSAVIGLILFLFPGAFVRVIALMLALICAVFGILRILGGVRGGAGTAGSILAGAAALVCGLYISLHAEDILSLLPIAAGILFVFSGAGRLGTALSLRAKGAKRWWGACILGALLCAAGAVLLFRPFSAVTFTIRVVGLFVLIDGLGDLWSSKEAQRAAKAAVETYTHRPQDGKIEGQFRDITDENRP